MRSSIVSKVPVFKSEKLAEFKTELAGIKPESFELEIIPGEQLITLMESIDKPSAMKIKV